VPAKVRKGTAQEGLSDPVAAQSADLGTGGVYLQAAEGAFAPGEFVTVTIEVPWELRRAFPFSRIMATCRVIRVDEPAASGQGKGVALEFCSEGTTMFGSIVTP